MATSSERIVYEFSGYIADPSQRRLSRGDKPLMLTPKAFDTLLTLIEHKGEVVSKDILMDSVWSDTAVEENNLTQQIATLRRTFGERAGDHRFIVTLPGKGYRFVAPVQIRGAAELEELTVVSSKQSNITIDLFLGSLWRSSGADRGRLVGSLIAAAYVLIVCVFAFWPVVSGSAESSPQSIAVLNFRVDTSEDERLGAGIRDTLRARIGSLADVELKASPVTSRPEDAVIAGREMHVDVVFSGSVQREAERVRVVVEMLDVKRERVVWGRTFDRNDLHSFELQDAIANEVVTALKLPA